MYILIINKILKLIYFNIIFLINNKDYLEHW